MKVLQVTSFFRPSWEAGGVARVCYALSKRLAERGHEVAVYTTDGFRSRVNVQKNCRVFMEGMDVFYFSNMSLFLASRNLCAPYMAPLIARKHMEEFDIIHMHTFRSALAVLIWYYANKYGIPYVLQAHGSVLPFFQKQRPKKVFDSLFGYRILKDASKVFALSRMEAEQYRGMGVPEEKIAVIPNGIDLSEYTDLPPEGSFKKKFGIDDDEKIVLYLGRIHRLKGIDFLVRSFAYLTKNGTENSKLVIAGPDDGYLDEVKFLVNSLGISDLVLFTGILPEEDKVSAYVDSSICTYLSPFEPFGLVTLEVAACGTPVIISRGTHMARVVEERKFGFSVKYNDIYELAETMRKVLNDNDLLREMGQKGRKFVLENFNWTDIVVKLEKVYEDVVKRNQ